jgi:proline utilization trans-activator
LGVPPPTSILLIKCPGYLGSSSSLSFSWRIRCILKRAVGDYVHINLIPKSEEETYKMASASIRDSLPLLDNELPSREYATYLSETTSFHLGEIYHVFEKDSFMLKLHQFYDEGWDNIRKPLKDLWHVQLLLVIAFGKLFLRRGASSLGPPGASDFLRALRLQPDVLDIWDDAVLRVEILCLISLYLLTADMRATAYVVVCIPPLLLDPRFILVNFFADWSGNANCIIVRYES